MLLKVRGCMELFPLCEEARCFSKSEASYGLLGGAHYTYLSALIGKSALKICCVWLTERTVCGELDGRALGEGACRHNYLVGVSGHPLQTWAVRFVRWAQSMYCTFSQCLLQLR